MFFFISYIIIPGVALQASMKFEMYSFYQWGRIYTYSNVSDNVINIRNATLDFAGTSQPETPKDSVTIHEQATYTVNVPLPPIPVNLTILVDLPRYATVMKTWKIRQLLKSMPNPPPIEGVFYEEGCFVNKTVVEDACVCYDSLSGNGTFHTVYPDWLPGCFEVPKLNCSRADDDGWVDEGNVTASNTSCVTLNGTQESLNTTNTTACPDIATSNLTSNLTSNVTSDQTSIPEVIAEEVCLYDAVQYQMCVDAMIAVCEENANLTELWEYVPDFIVCNETDNVDVGNATLNTTGNWTQSPGNATLNATTGNWTTQSPPTDSTDTINASHITPSCKSLQNGGLCRYFAQDFCINGSSLRICPVSVGDLRTAILNDSMVVQMKEMNTTVFNDTALYVQDLLVDDQNVMCACQHLEPPGKDDYMQGWEQGNKFLGIWSQFRSRYEIFYIF